MTNLPAKKANLGTFSGVFTPSILTILGIILFLRLGFVVGSAGLGRALLQDNKASRQEQDEGRQADSQVTIHVEVGFQQPRHRQQRQRGDDQPQ